MQDNNVMDFLVRVMPEKAYNEMVVMDYYGTIHGEVPDIMVD